jgi:hypothetical protein
MSILKAIFWIGLVALLLPHETSSDAQRSDSVLHQIRAVLADAASQQPRSWGVSNEHGAINMAASLIEEFRVPRAEMRTGINPRPHVGELAASDKYR